MGFGDGENDMTMIRMAGIGVAMGNAFSILKEVLPLQSMFLLPTLTRYVSPPVSIAETLFSVSVSAGTLFTSIY